MEETTVYKCYQCGGVPTGTDQLCDIDRELSKVRIELLAKYGNPSGPWELSVEQNKALGEEYKKIKDELHRGTS